METPTDQKALSTRAILRKKDTAFVGEQPNGTLNLSGDTISFVSDTGQEDFTIKLSEITDADMTNIFAKAQIIFTTNQGVQHIVSFGRGQMLADKKTSKFLFIPGGLTYHMFDRMVDANQDAQAWKEALVNLLPANAIRQRAEVHWMRTIAISLLICFIIVGILAAVITYFHLKSLNT